MALLSKEEHEGLLRRIAETGGATPEMLEDIQKLRDEYDERMGELRRYGERRDKDRPEGSEEEERKLDREDRRDEREDRRDDRDDVESRGEREVDPTDWRGKYEEIRKKYIDRFFTSPEEVKEDQEEDVKRDGEKVTFEELFKEREG